MYDRLDEVPVYALRQGKVSATHYNHVLVALKRLGEELPELLPDGLSDVIEFKKKDD